MKIITEYLEVVLSIKYYLYTNNKIKVINKLIKYYNNLIKQHK